MSDAPPPGGLFRTRSVESLLSEAEGGPSRLARHLGPGHLVLMGVGVIIGAGIFVVTGAAAAQFAGPAIVLSFFLAAAGCALSALCYAEFAALIPVSGSAYTYASATLGELVAWVIGWNLVMEYAFAASYVSVGWSGYCVSLLHSAGVVLPRALTVAPLAGAGGGVGLSGGLVNLPAVLVVLAVLMVARRGIRLSAGVNAAIVALKVGALALFMAFGALYVVPAHWTPFIPPNTGAFGHFGWSGVLRGAAVVFVAYLGFDAVATTAQETRNPQRNLPIGILGSLVVCTLLYSGVSLVLTGLAPYRSLDAPNPLTVALAAAGGRLAWLVPIIDAAAVLGLASVLLVVLLAQPRVLLAMARDGLLPGPLARVDAKSHAPSTATLVSGLFVAVLAGLFPIDVLVQLVSLGTLCVFIAVCVGVVVLRRTRPDLKRPFRAPLSPVLPLLGALICAYLLAGLPLQSWELYGAWTVIGALIYFGYGRRSATRRRAGEPKARPIALTSVVAIAVACTVAAVNATTAHAAPALRPPAYQVEEKSLAELEADLRAGRVTSAELVRAYLRRIDQLDRHGPQLRSVIAINPDALAEARTLDAEARAGHWRGPLHGLPILVKDNIETADPLPTTAGSLALWDNVTGRDAPLVARLRAAGAVILGKANLSEWANMRASHPTNGWSAVGGMVRNPYALDRSPCGSSAGSAVAVAASLAAAAIGTETDGSIDCPSAMNGDVGLKPTVGLIPRTFIIPISRTWDTPGPIGRSVADVAALLTVMAGSDGRDPASAPADAHKGDYAASLDPDTLRGRRLGVLRFDAKFDPRVAAVFDQAVAELRAAGAEVVEIDAGPSMSQIGRNEWIATITEYRAGLGAYLAAAPPAVTTRSIADLITFDLAHADAELPFSGQERFTDAEAAKGLDDPDYLAARGAALRLAGPDGIDKLLADNHVDALVAPTTGPAFAVDLLGADHMFTDVLELAAVAGYPHLTVPMGQIDGLPVGLSFIGPAWSEQRLLALGYAYEQHTHHRRPPSYARFAALPEVAPHLAPSRP